MAGLEEVGSCVFHCREMETASLSHGALRICESAHTGEKRTRVASFMSLAEKGRAGMGPTRPTSVGECGNKVR